MSAPPPSRPMAHEGFRHRGGSYGGERVFTVEGGTESPLRVITVEAPSTVLSASVVRVARVLLPMHLAKEDDVSDTAGAASSKGSEVLDEERVPCPVSHPQFRSLRSSDLSVSSFSDPSTGSDRSGT